MAFRPSPVEHISYLVIQAQPTNAKCLVYDEFQRILAAASFHQIPQRLEKSELDFRRGYPRP